MEGKKKEGRKFTFELVYRHPDLSSWKLPCRSYNYRLKRYEILLVDGSITHDESVNDSLVYKCNLTQTRLWKPDEHTRDKAKQKELFATFTYVDEGQEQNLSGIEKEENRLKRALHGFLKTCNGVFVKGADGNNTNENLGKVAYVNLIDTNQEVLKDVDNSSIITQYSAILKSKLDNSDAHGELVDLAYVLGIQGIDKMDNIESLYRAVFAVLLSNAQYFKGCYEATDRSLKALVRKGMYMPLSDGKTALYMENEYYYMDGIPVGKTEEELVAHFNLNPQSVTALEKKLGIFFERVSLPKASKESPIQPTKSPLAEKMETLTAVQKSVKQKIYATAYKYKDKQDKSGYEKDITALHEEYPEHKELIDFFKEKYAEQFIKKGEQA